MEKDIERKIGLLHALYALVAAFFTDSLVASLNLGDLNLLNTLALGFLIAYPMMFITKWLFKLSKDEFLFKDWIVKGFFLFFVTWIFMWTVFHNF
ncbi:MAG: hypothetical protein ACE5HY_00830 [Candidatus Hydrothermarchaeales archaeon]